MRDEGWGMREEGKKRKPSGGHSRRVMHPEGYAFNPLPSSPIPHPSSLIPSLTIPRDK